MPLPRAFQPLRHGTFRTLWLATLASNIGTWVQNTGAGWLMTSLDPSPLMVSLVQAASMLPVFLLGLLAGALADIVDRRLFLIGAQLWVLAMGLLLAALTAAGVLGPWGLLALTFAIGAGAAMNFPAWAATTPELVPREDLVGAIALNGIGFNLARAIGPALGGFAIAVAGAEAAFTLNAVTFLVLILALLGWRRRPMMNRLPKERLVAAMAAGLRFVRATPAMHAAIIRACSFFLFSAAVWGLLPLIVRERLGLGPEAFGLMLAAMGGGAVGAGFLLPALRGFLDRGAQVFWASLLAAAAMALLAAARHWLPAGIAMLAYGAAWITAGSTLSTAAQLAAPAWVRARAIAIYQLSFFGALSVGAA
ncbi:MAG TPA: MFS transporter, partial [Crenalkalicoccus sp.]|nr:MFS transporter [Crenalkalicoccus sp.]